MEQTENYPGKRQKFYKLLSKKYKKIMYAIKHPGHTSTDTITNNQQSDTIDFVDFSNLQFKNNRLINKYQDKVIKETINLITNLLPIDYNDDYDDDHNDDLKIKNNNKLTSSSSSSSATSSKEITSIDINKYTTIIELEKIRFNRQLFLKLFIHINLLKRLEEQKVINWHSNTSWFYPIKTLGDGNCLCHAVLIYLIGTHDNSLILRTALRNYINGKNANKIKERYFFHREESDKQNKIQTEDKQLEQEWKEIQTMIKSEKVFKTETKKEEIVETLIYLEDIHIFSLANLLKRPIIVVALEKIKDLQPSNIRGIYLPLLNEPSKCIKEPILIAFHNFHFCPLLYANYDEKLNNIDKKENYDTLFLNSDLNLTKFNEKYEKRYIYFPLNYYNWEAMKVHFLKENEEKRLQDIIRNYLDIIEIPSKEIDSEDEIPFCCCKIGTNQKLKINGLNAYLDYLNEEYNCIDYDDEYLNNVDTTIRQIVPSINNTPRRRSHDGYKCIIRDCKNESENHGYCNRCYYYIENEKRSKSQPKYECLYPNCNRSAVKSSSYCEMHSKLKCVNQTCELEGKSEFKGYCKSCFNYLYSIDYDKCRQSNCNKYAVNGSYCEMHSKIKCINQNCELEGKSEFRGYCKSCFNYLNSDIEKCKQSNCNRYAVNGCQKYCKECFDKYKCKTNECKNLIAIDSYCNDCYRTIQTTYRICKSSNCSKFASIVKNNGYCDDCYENRKNTINNVETLYMKQFSPCSFNNCNEPATQSGYCSKCFRLLYNSNTCKSKTCLNTSVTNGYCSDCFEINKCKIQDCKNEKVLDGLCQECYYNMNRRVELLYPCSSSDCSSYIAKKNSFCDDCLEKYEKTKRKPRDGITEIPITIESRPNTANNIISHNDYYSFTPTRTNLTRPATSFISAYNQTPEQISLIRNDFHNNIVCKFCHQMIPSYLRQNNEKLCNKCMSKYFNTYGRHYNNDGLFI